MLTRFAVLRLVLSVLALTAIACLASAAILGHGTYHGYATTDRWGQHVFHSGPYHLFTTAEVAEALAEYRGQPLELHVSRMAQPMNPGAGTIHGFDKVSVKGSEIGLRLSAAAQSQTVRQGDGVRLRLSLRNVSQEPITVAPWRFAVILVTNSPFSNAAIGYKDPDDYGYWKYRYVYREALIVPPSRDDKKPPTVACREIPLRWTPKGLAERGQGIRRVDEHRVRVDPTRQFEADVVVGKELLPGEYEAFFYMETGNFSKPAGPRSARIAFDVVAAKR